MEQQTTLYVRGMPEDVVREAKALAARRGTTLSTLVTEALRKVLDAKPPETRPDPLAPLRPDMEWYEQNRARLVRRYDGEHVAIIDKEVVDHDKDFDPLARRVYAKYGYRAIFMPQVAIKDPVIRFRSPRIVRQ